VTRPNADDRELARITKQLEDIKRLMIVQLIATGVQPAQIGKALGLDPSRISQLVPVRDIQTAVKRARRTAEPDG
jgi:hypothetical protein